MEFYLNIAYLQALGSSSLLFLADMSRVSVINSQVIANISKITVFL